MLFTAIVLAHTYSLFTELIATVESGTCSSIHASSSNSTRELKVALSSLTCVSSG